MANGQRVASDRSGTDAAADLLLLSAGVAVAAILVVSPKLRRVAIRGLRLWLGASVPVFILGQIRQAWIESGREHGPGPAGDEPAVRTAAMRQG